MREFEERHAPRWVKLGLSVGSGLLFATGFFVGAVLRSVELGVLLFALGAMLFAIRGYLNTGDKAGGHRHRGYRLLLGTVAVVAPLGNRCS